ncbi:hypothetical protein [Tsukamurella paurometabola]|uniref:Uncharacterized protein n=1 Tax=Tsukamurella paurometabola TaxID=2061 RepID=A0ABS5NIH8_TSUPA|nr:hypothetical protein [Tsukamurella paurometabola]MBS4104104.1 hypothetical protein [Tsukamurella paurometabola]
MYTNDSLVPSRRDADEYTRAEWEAVWRTAQRIEHMAGVDDDAVHTAAYIMAASGMDPVAACGVIETLRAKPQRSLRGRAAGAVSAVSWWLHDAHKGLLRAAARMEQRGLIETAEKTR